MKRMIHLGVATALATTVVGFASSLALAASAKNTMSVSGVVFDPGHHPNE